MMELNSGKNAEEPSVRRNRWIYGAAIVIVVAAGLASRSRLVSHLPLFIGEYAGDTLWALMVYLGIGFFFPNQKTSTVAVAALVISLSVEFSQLYRGEWLNQIRSTRPGALILGAGFLWSDLLCYGVGIAMGAVGEFMTRSRLRVRKLE